MSAEPLDGEFPPGASKERPKKKPNGEVQNDLPIPVGESAFALTERDIPDPVRLCDPWATEGITIIAGRPKLGKTTLERQKLAAAAAGSAFLDSSFPKPVLCAFLSLEEGELLTRMKFKQPNFTEAALVGIDIHFKWERGAIGVEQLERYLDANPDVQFVVIDSLSRFRAVPDVRTPAFMADYEAMSLLNECSKRHPGVCIDVIHHTRKAKGDDPMDDISGTYGIPAVATTCIVLRHHADGAAMFIEGRLWTRNDNNYILKRAGGQWEMVGVNIGLPDEQIETLNIIKAHPEGIGGTALGDKLAITQPSAWQRIDILIEKGFVVKRHGRAYIKGVVP